MTQMMETLGGLLDPRDSWGQASLLKPPHVAHHSLYLFLGSSLVEWQIEKKLGWILTFACSSDL